MSLVTETLYIQSATDLKTRYERICQIIEALELRTLNVNVANSDVSEYWLDDGQIKIKTIYRSAEEMWKAIEAFERLKQKLLNQLNGRTFVVRPARGLK